MTDSASPLLNFLNDQPRAVSLFSPRQWSQLIREARSANLLSRVAGLLAEPGDVPGIPAKIQTHIDSANRVGSSSARSVRWEVTQIQEVLGAAGIPFVLLKGAAYELANLPPAKGRLFVDVDIMVPRPELLATEKAFLLNGWTTTKLNAYDQRYYRKWMHEIPPLRHMTRGTSLDVHHTILPLTARLKPDVDKFWAAATELPELPNVYILGSEDMVLHSAAHLFHDGDLKGGFRDLVDLDVLIRHFSKDIEFMGRLLDRAQEMDLLPPLHYVLRYTSKYLGTPIPDQILDKCKALAAPPRPMGYIMDSLVARAFYPEIRAQRSPLSSIAQWLLYVRSHYLRMPLYLLLPHLLRKAIKPEGS